ncbi:MAG: threonine synthase [Candidatus Rifleibacteriota bacterium]
MKLFNLKHPEEIVSFSQAVRQGMGSDRGLFFPLEIPALQNIADLLPLPFVERSCRVLDSWIGSELGSEVVEKMVKQAFDFSVPIVEVEPGIFSLELFHGPTLAFKDFGARFMAQCLSTFAGDEKITILTATSGDTGAAVAHAFYGLNNVNVVVLYPEGKISPLQEKLFCCLGSNIRTISVSADFDACQELVKKAFVDADIRAGLKLNSANSINISRLLAQICYYFEAVAQTCAEGRPVISVPSGNFGNLTAGLLAQAMGLPVKRFIAATNSNDTVPRYLKNRQWLPGNTVATASNAMDVAEPSNWPRVEAVFSARGGRLEELVGISVDEEQTFESLRQLYSAGYLSEPHAAVAAAALRQSLKSGEHGVFLATAHPAKFKESVEQALGINLELPPELARVRDGRILSLRISNDFLKLKEILLS